MSLISPVFKQHYKDYLKQIGHLDFNILTPFTGGRILAGTEKAIEISYFNTPYRISGSGITDEFGKKPGYDTCIILCRYLIMAGDRAAGNLPGIRKSDGWAGFRDLKDSGPLTVYFKENVETAIANSLAGKLPLSIKDFAKLGAAVPDIEVSYDIALQIYGLPRVPMLILANDAEDGFSASCSVLFRPDVENFIDAECIAMTGYRLAKRIGNMLN